MTDDNDAERWARKARNREKTVREILATEETYIKRLKYIRDHYKIPLSQGKPRILTPEQVEALFPSVLNNLLMLNERLVVDLGHMIDEWDNDKSMLAHVFLEFNPYFKMYTDYVNNHEKAVTLIRQLQEQSTWQKYCSQKKELCDNLDLPSLLILPIQRPPRYELLLREIIKQTHPSHPDLEDLKKAYDKIVHVNKTINKSMDECKKRREVLIVEESIGGPQVLSLVAPARRLVKQGYLWKVSRARNIKYMFFLFTDMLLYCSDAGKGKFKLHKKLDVNGAFQVKDVSEDEFKNSFQVLSMTKSFIAHTEKPEEKVEWMECFKEVVQHLQKRPTVPGRNVTKTTIAPIWDQDHAHTTCTMPDCDTKFSWMTRKHHCRFCGRLVCHDCSKYRLPSRHKANIYERACKLCNKEWKDKAPTGGDPFSSHEVATEAPSVIGETASNSDIPADLSKLQRCEALYDYEAEKSGDLAFSEGDVIIILEQETDWPQWWRGKHQDEEKGRAAGLFPSNYVKVLPRETMEGQILIARLNYDSNSKEEITLVKGQRYRLMMKDMSGWWLVCPENDESIKGWTSPQLVRAEGEPDDEEEVAESISPSNAGHATMQSLSSAVSETNDPVDSQIDESLLPQATRQQSVGLPRPSVKMSSKRSNASTPPAKKKEKFKLVLPPQQQDKEPVAAVPPPAPAHVKAKQSPAPAAPQAAVPPPAPVQAKKAKPAPVQAKKAKPAPVQAKKPAPVQAKKPAPAADSGNGAASAYPYEQVLKWKKKEEEPPAGIDKANLENYLSDEDFKKYLGIDRSAYAPLPKWKKKKHKIQAKLW